MLSSSGASVVRRHSSLVAGQDLSFYSHPHPLRQRSVLTKNVERLATKQVEALVLSTYSQSMYEGWLPVGSIKSQPLARSLSLVVALTHVFSPKDYKKYRAAIATIRL